MTAAEKQRLYRERQRRIERMDQALRQIVTILEGKAGPVATAIRAAAEEGLKA